MEIVTIEYRESKQFGGCREAQVGMTAELGGDEDAVDALNDAKIWVRTELANVFCEQQQYEADHRRSLALERHLDDLRDDIRTYEERIDSLKKTWEQAKKFLFRHGLDADLYVAGLPFEVDDQDDLESGYRTKSA